MFLNLECQGNYNVNILERSDRQTDVLTYHNYMVAGLLKKCLLPPQQIRTPSKK